MEDDTRNLKDWEKTPQQKFCELMKEGGYKYACEEGLKWMKKYGKPYRKPLPSTGDPEQDRINEMRETDFLDYFSDCWEDHIARKYNLPWPEDLEDVTWNAKVEHFDRLWFDAEKKEGPEAKELYKRNLRKEWDFEHAKWDLPKDEKKSSGTSDSTKGGNR